MYPNDPESQPPAQTDSTSSPPETIPGLRFRTDAYNLGEMRLINQIARLGGNAEEAWGPILDLLYLRVDPACRSTLDRVTVEQFPAALAMAQEGMATGLALTLMSAAMAGITPAAIANDRAYPQNRAGRRQQQKGRR